MRKPRLRDIDGTAYDTETGERDESVPWYFASLTADTADMWSEKVNKAWGNAWYDIYEKRLKGTK